MERRRGLASLAAGLLLSGIVGCMDNDSKPIKAPPKAQGAMAFPGGTVKPNQSTNFGTTGMGGTTQTGAQQIGARGIRRPAARLDGYEYGWNRNNRRPDGAGQLWCRNSDDAERFGASDFAESVVVVHAEGQRLPGQHDSADEPRASAITCRCPQGPYGATPGYPVPPTPPANGAGGNPYGN